MTLGEVLAALGLPEESRVERRIPKKMLLESGAPVTGARRLIETALQELTWVAVLKPTTIGVAAYRDAVREYLELSVLKMALRASPRAGRLVERVHRAIPYPVVLLTEGPEGHSLSLAHKRWSLGEEGRTVLDGDVVVAVLDGVIDPIVERAFLDALPLLRQPRASLYSVYQGWMDTALALQAARATGTFAVASTVERAAIRREALKECARLEAEMAGLHAAAAKERQLARQVDLNLELERLRAAHAAARAKL